MNRENKNMYARILLSLESSLKNMECLRIGFGVYREIWLLNLLMGYTPSLTWNFDKGLEIGDRPTKAM